MTWEDILKQDNIVGGDIETQEDGDVYRGPISEVRFDNGLLHITSPWVAKMEGGLRGDGKWKNWNVYPFFINTREVRPQDLGDGRIGFSMPLLGFGVIFPKGGSKLDPSKVEGLSLTEPAT